jgi:hypothetical protein
MEKLKAWFESSDQSRFVLLGCVFRPLVRNSEILGPQLDRTLVGDFHPRLADSLLIGDGLGGLTPGFL